MLPTRYLAINELPADATSDDVRRAFERFAVTARHRGIHPLETFYALDQHRAYTLIEAPGDAEIRMLCDASGLPLVDVVRAGRLYTDVLDQPNRAR